MNFKDIYRNLSEDLVSDDIYFNEDENLAIRIDEAESRDIVINSELTLHLVRSDVGYIIDVYGSDLENPIDTLTYWDDDLDGTVDDDFDFGGAEDELGDMEDDPYPTIE